MTADLTHWRALAIKVRSTGVVNVGFIDPQGAGSTPVLRGTQSVVSLGPDQILSIAQTTSNALASTF